MNVKLFAINLVYMLAFVSSVGNSLDFPGELPVLEKLPTIVSVEHQSVPVSIKASVAANTNEKSVYAVQEAHAGYELLTHPGVTVRTGTPATMRFHMRFRGISSAHLAKKDQRFIETLSKPEREKYFEKKKNYRGGLGVVFLRFLGIDLDSKANRQSQDKARRYTRQYNRKAATAKAILGELVTSSVIVSGNLTVLCIRFRPTTAFAFIKVARVKLSSGQGITVVSSNKNAVTMLTTDGMGGVISHKQVSIEDYDDFYSKANN